MQCSAPLCPCSPAPLWVTTIPSLSDHLVTQWNSMDIMWSRGALFQTMCCSFSTWCIVSNNSLLSLNFVYFLLCAFALSPSPAWPPLLSDNPIGVVQIINRVTSCSGTRMVRNLEMYQVMPMYATIYVVSSPVMRGVSSPVAEGTQGGAVHSLGLLPL